LTACKFISIISSTMNIYALIPLVATIAYIPLFVILLSNRPWQSRQKLFFLFLISAMLWSTSDIFFRSDFFMQDKLLLVKAGLCIAIWMVIQYRYFLQSFYKSQVAKRPFAYILLAAVIGLTALGYIPGNITVTTGGIDVGYGTWLLLTAAVLLIITSKDFHHLIRKLKVTANAVERNQIIYLFVGLACLAIFGFVTFAPPARAYPVSHIGNFLNAFVLTYAVMAHRLLDVRIIFRRALTYLGLYGGGLAVLLLLFFLAHLLFGFRPDFTTLALVIGMGIPVIVFLIHKARDFLQAKVEEAFIGARYPYRKQLSNFVTKIQNVPTLEQSGSEFISLLSQSVDCRRACLLLPQAEDGGFRARFIYSPVKDNLMRELKLRQDSPVVAWLKHKSTILLERNLAIFPEFQSMWQEEREEIQSAGVEIFVPLMNRGELVAVLAVSERGDGKLYTVEDVDLLESTAAQVAASMEKEYFHEQLREQDKEITLINRLTIIITSSVSIQEKFEGFVQELKKVVDVDWATVALIDGSELYFLALSSTIGSAWQTGERIPLEATATEWVCREKKSLYEADLARYRRFWTGEYHLKQGIRSIVYLPLSIKGQSTGSLVLASRKPNAYSHRQIRLLEQVALQIATPIENAQLYARAEQRSRIDELTGLFNRRHFEERLKEEISRHSRYGGVFSVFLLDLDNFKTYNDIYGHPAGDILLNQIGKIIKGSVRSADQAFRYGGDEFVVILPQTAPDDAYVVAERVRKRIAGEMEEKGIAVTCSIGLASYPSDGVISGELVTVADTALYYAKRTGGNRVYLSSKILSEPLDEAGIYARRNGLSTVYALVSTVEARDPYTYGHSRKVNTYAVALAESIGLPPDDVSKVSTAALLHDIGKIGIPDKVLKKKGKLNEEDWEAIKSHPRLGANIVGNIPNLVPCVSTILYHHERWDGSGYPEGLKGEQIPIEARILAIADSFEAMTSARPYRPALSLEEVIKELKKGAGGQFDPKLVEVFIGIVEAGLPEKQEQVGTGLVNRQAQSQMQ
jgi:diguanylate cyclase (GGDEF)-like protein/putative nucleotidyltransferase with HDIG domain